MDALVTICSGYMLWAWMLCSPYAPGLEHERKNALDMDAQLTVCPWNTNGIMVWAWMLCSPCALGTRTELKFGHGCSGHRMLLEHERNYGLDMDVLVAVCSWNTNGIMVWAWVLWSPCSWNTNGILVWAWVLWSPYALGTRMELKFGHGCSGHRMLLEHERNYRLGMDALVSVCSWNTNGIEVWAWILWSPYALGCLGMDALFTVCSWNMNGIEVWAWMLW